MLSWNLQRCEIPENCRIRISFRRKKNKKFKDYAFCGFLLCPDSFLECQCFVNLAVHFIRARSSLILFSEQLRSPSGTVLYITLLSGGKEENCGAGEGMREWISPH